MIAHTPLGLCADAAQWLIENGAEISYAQDAVAILGKSLGMRQSECFALPTGLFVTIVDKAGFVATAVRRVRRRGLHLERLSRIQQVIRDAATKKMSEVEAFRRLNEAAETGKNAWYVLIGAAGLGSGAFAMFFGGSFADGLACLILGFAWMGLRLLLERLGSPDVLVAALGGFCVILGSELGPVLFPILHANFIAIGALMLLVPGLALVNALRDLVAGDLVSSLARLVEVLLIGAAIVGGATGAFSLFHFLSDSGVHA